MYELLYKIVDKGVIVGYTVVDPLTKKKINLTKDDAMRSLALIRGAYNKNEYIALKHRRMSSVPEISLTSIKPKRVVDKKYSGSTIMGETQVNMGGYKKKVYRDCTNLPIVTDIQLDGVGSKIVVRDRDKRLMLKFARTKMGHTIRDYLTEYIGCNIAKKLGYRVQEVELGYFEGKECGVVTMFDYTPITFAGFGYSTAEGNVLLSGASNYSLDWLLSLKMNKKFAITNEQYRQWVYSVFALDMLVGNYDRHENNWGFEFKDNLYRPAPLYDMGASFYPQLIGADVETKNIRQIKHIIEFETKSSILYKGKRRNYYDLYRIYSHHSQLKSEMENLLSRAKKIDPTVVFQTVIDYNKDYTEYIEFLYKVWDIKLKGIEVLLNE